MILKKEWKRNILQRSSKAVFSVRRTDYTLFELNNGVLALIGCPKSSFTEQSSVNNVVSTTPFVGPITGIFIHPEKAPVFNIVPRYTYGSATSRYIINEI